MTAITESLIAGGKSLAEAARAEMNAARVERVCAWTGPILLLAFLGALVGLCDFWPPRPPSWDAEQIKAFYLEGTTAKRVGIAICLFAWVLMVPWGIALAAQTARIEAGFRVLSIMQVVSAGAMMAVGEMMLLIWGVNTFRPDELSADTMRMLNDLGWFIFVMYWAPGVLWCWSIFAAILLDTSAVPVFPRWVGYFNFWIGLSFFPACLGLFFKSGPFAYDGLITVWLPAGLFFIWYGVMTHIMLKIISAREQKILMQVRESMQG